MKNKKTSILILLILIIAGYFQGILYSPLTPKAAAISHFKINPKLIPIVKEKIQNTASLSEAEIKDKHGRLELIRLTNSAVIRGVVFEQGETYIRVETQKGILQIPTNEIDSVEIIR